MWKGYCFNNVGMEFLNGLLFVFDCIISALFDNVEKFVSFAAC